MDQLRAMLGPADRDQDAARERGAARGLHRPVLRLRAVGRRHPEGDRNRRDRLREPAAAGGGDEYTQPMVRLVNALLVDAVKRGASDIHFEPEYAFLRIRYRIDGVLETVRSLHKTYLPGHHGAGEGGERHEHRRDARAAGRAAVADAERPADRLPRVHAAHDLRREHRAARARPREIDHQPRPHEPHQGRRSTRSTSCWRGPRAS